jgi:hypothetical protein
MSSAMSDRPKVSRELRMASLLQLDHPAPDRAVLTIEGATDANRRWRLLGTGRKAKGENDSRISSATNLSLTPATMKR